MYDNNDDFIPLQISAIEENGNKTEKDFPVDTNASSQSMPAMRNVKDLVNTLARMNKRLVELEEENQKLQAEIKSKAEKREVVKMISNAEALNIAKNGLTSDSFIVRAISVYGHWFVVNLIVSIILGIIGAILFATVLNGIASSLLNSGL